MDWLEENDFMRDSNKSFNYLINMPIYQMTSDMVEQLKETLKNKQDEFNSINDKTLKNMWLDDLNELDKALNSHMLNILKVDEPVHKKTKRTKKK